MSPKQEQRIQHHAVKAAVRASKRIDHPLTEAELMRLKVQVMPGPLRITLGLAGGVLLLCALAGWPLAGGVAQWLEGLSGGLMMGIGAFGVRRTFSGIVDALGNVGAEALLEAVLSTIGSLAD
jgi:hypothetical protein